MTWPPSHWADLSSAAFNNSSSSPASSNRNIKPSPMSASPSQLTITADTPGLHQMSHPVDPFAPFHVPPSPPNPRKRRPSGQPVQATMPSPVTNPAVAYTNVPAISMAPPPHQQPPQLHHPQHPHPSHPQAPHLPTPQQHPALQSPQHQQQQHPPPPPSQQMQPQLQPQAAQHHPQGQQQQQQQSHSQQPQQQHQPQHQQPQHQQQQPQQQHQQQQQQQSQSEQQSPVEPQQSHPQQSPDAIGSAQPPPAKKGRTNTPWTPAEEQRLKNMRDAGKSWSDIAKTFPNRTEGSVKKHWYKDMHYAEFAEDESAALLTAIKEYEANKWKAIGSRVGKPAKACEQYAKEHFGGKV